MFCFFFFSSRRRHTRCYRDWSSDVCSSDLWKLELGRLAAETGLQITVCHFPPGTSKWNHIEHRRFSAISTNWRGRPLTSHEVMVEVIGATTTRAGLKVHAERDLATYPKRVAVTAQELAAVPPKPHKFHGEWNYTVRPPKRAPG